MIMKAENFYSDHVDELVKLNYYIYKNPELGNQEIKARDAHTNLLEKNGFQIEKEFIGIKTAFKATYTSKKNGPNIAFLAEYDALPKIGHGCGHNILGTASTGAGLILKELIEELGGKVMVIGTPAEETDGAKVDMAKAGVFENIDIVMSAHPTGKFHVESGSSQAMEALKLWKL